MGPRNSFRSGTRESSVTPKVEIAQPADQVRERITADNPTLGKEYPRRARINQAAFQLMTIDNFKYKCCITGETTSPVLQAAHIQPVSQDGRHSIRKLPLPVAMVCAH